MEWPQVLTAVGTTLKRRIAKYIEREDVAEAVAAAAELAQLLDETEQQAVAVSFWLDVSGEDIEFGDFVEEAVMPTG
jgi:predicted ATP-dependent protease